MSLLRVVIVLFVLISASAIFARDLPSPSDGLVVHEWGTFTSIADPDGKPMPWASLEGSADLPCFVDHLASVGVKYTSGLVRMETPVLYFYSSEPRNVSVHVEFPRGLITEWYPNVTKVIPESKTVTNLEKGQIDWGSVDVSPGDTSGLPSTRGASRYYAARHTDSTPLVVGAEHEKMIFYRGVGNPPVPVQPAFASDGNLDIRNVAPQPVPLAILFENRNGAAGYRVAHGLAGLFTVQPPELTGNLGELRNELVTALEDAGLFRKEAEAMVETWGDSWFEEGMRLFYIVPREQVDEQLPLAITPWPSSIQRVFVARIELLSPPIEATIRSAASLDNVAGLTKYGRFLDPFLTLLEKNGGNSLHTGTVEKALAQLAQQAKASTCVH